MAGKYLPLPRMEFEVKSLFGYRVPCFLMCLYMRATHKDKKAEQKKNSKAR